MASTRTRVVRMGAAILLAAVGVLSFEAVTQVAGAAPPPVIATDYATYPAPLPAGCTAEGGAFLTGYRAFYERAGQPVVPDPGGGGAMSGRSMRRFEDDLLPGDTVVVRWTGWAAGCDSLAVSFPLKATNAPFFDLRDDQALVREPNGPFVFPFCYSSGAESCQTGAVYELRTTIPQLNVVCGFQLDMVIGGPLETVGPKGAYYANSNRTAAANAGLGTFNTSGPNMLIDAANGAMPCQAGDRLVVDKQWVGSGNVPPVNVPPEFLLTVTSSVSQADLTVISTATCQVTGGAFTCSYEDASAPGVPQGGLLVNADSMLTVTESGFPGNSVDITFPVGMSSKYVACQPGGTTCLFTITNTPPPPPSTTTTAPPLNTTTTAAAGTSIVPPTSPATLPISIPATLPATGSSDSTPLLLLAVLLVPMGVAMVAVTRRRATSD